MPVPTLKVPTSVRNLIRGLHPTLKRKIRAALADILQDPTCGKALEHELKGYWSLRIGRHRIIYRPDRLGIELVAIGPRRTIYEDLARQVLRARRRNP
jgi:mRNA interferase RelE/StbE